MSAGHLCSELPGGGRALFTDRSHGNLSSVGGDGADRGAQARERLRELLGVAALARGYQVHGAHVATVIRPPGRAGAGNEGLEQADGQATALPGVGAMVLTADCVPVALGTMGAVAMIHAGWRGLAAGVLEEGVRALEAIAPEEPVAALLGPGAGPCCYEVGDDVHDALRSGVPGTGPRRIDLRSVARERLRAAGVEDVREVAACTICDERFFSHRREGARAGRQAGVAWLS
jgi:purine-nucleoside/S-methyl-5'-thioadenosine phosphorylase / adenosine deaminase